MHSYFLLFAKRTGTAIYKYSSLDALMLILVLTASVLNLLIPLEISLWIIMRNFVLWFGTSFIIKKKKKKKIFEIYLKNYFNFF